MRLEFMTLYYICFDNDMRSAFASWFITASDVRLSKTALLLSCYRHNGTLKITLLLKKKEYTCPVDFPQVDV